MASKTIKSLFGSNTRVKLLELFFSNPDKDYYVRELTRVIDEQVNSVRRELANLLAARLVKKTSKDNKIYYSVNPNFQNYLAFAMIFDEKFDPGSLSKNTVVELSQEVNVQISDKNNKIDWKKMVSKIDDYARVIILSGQLVSGSESKIDMLIVGDNSTKKISDWCQKIEQIKDLSLSYSIIDYDEFYYRYSVKDKFLIDILDSKNSIILNSTELKLEK